MHVYVCSLCILKFNKKISCTKLRNYHTHAHFKRVLLVCVCIFFYKNNMQTYGHVCMGIQTRKRIKAQANERMSVFVKIRIYTYDDKRKR